MKKFLEITAGVGGLIITADFLFDCYHRVRRYFKKKSGKSSKVMPLSGQTIGFKTKAEPEAINNG